MSALKLCINCRWHGNPDRPAAEAHCICPQVPRTIELVTGESKPLFLYCSTHRERAGDGLCGPEGRWFLPKPAEETPVEPLEPAPLRPMSPQFEADLIKWYDEHDAKGIPTGD